LDRCPGALGFETVNNTLDLGTDSLRVSSSHRWEAAMNMNRRALLCSALFAELLASNRAMGQDAKSRFPSRPLRIIVPFAPGGPSDTVARAIGQKLGDSFTQSVVVDNRPGGGSQIGVSALKQSTADGHTFMIGDIGALAVNVSLYEKLSYDPVKDFAPLTLLMAAPMVLMVKADSPFASIGDMVAAARSGTRTLTLASQGIGTGGHLMLEVFKNSTGLNIVHIPYKGSAPAVQDVLAGQVDGLFEALPQALPYATTGKARIIAVCTDQRLAALPDAPTSTEAGLPDLKMDAWWAAVTLADTPDAVVRQLADEIGKAMLSAEVYKRFVEQGFVVQPGGPQKLDALMRAEIERWAVVVRRSGAKVQ
jgi:tripartite-type tricarboxylate transporter receptor subunit TctC